MTRKIQLLIAGILAFVNALICKGAWLEQPDWILALLCWFFAATSIVACWKLIRILEKE